MAFSRIGAGVNGQGNGTTATTAAVNSSGGRFAIAVVTHRGSVTLSDSKSNPAAWQLLLSATDGTNIVGIYLLPLSITGSGHTFTAASSTAPSIDVQVYGMDLAVPVIDKTNTNTNASASSLATGSVVPAYANELLIAGAFISGSGRTVSSVDSSFTIQASGAGDANNFGNALADLIETTATTKNPTFTFNATDTCLAAIVTLREVGGGQLTWSARASLLG